MEVSGLMGQMPSRLGYQPTEEAAADLERIADYPERTLPGTPIGCAEISARAAL